MGFLGVLVHCAKRISDDDDDDKYTDDDGKYIGDNIEERTVGPIAARESRLVGQSEPSVAFRNLRFANPHFAIRKSQMEIKSERRIQEISITPLGSMQDERLSLRI